MELWDLPVADGFLLTNISLLDDAAQYPSCNNGNMGSAVLEDATLNTVTVAYYNGITPGSSACFVCDDDSGYALDAPVNVRICQSDATWSRNSMMCGTSCHVL